jgi:hypothetical protein
MQRLDDALNVRERLIALEAKVDAQKRNGTEISLTGSVVVPESVK